MLGDPVSEHPAPKSAVCDAAVPNLFPVSSFQKMLCSRCAHVLNKPCFEVKSMTDYSETCGV